MYRLGTMWAGIEPEPGQFNQTYVNILKEIVEKYKSDQIYFILDMHQDVLWETPGLFTFCHLFVDIIQLLVLPEFWLKVRYFQKTRQNTKHHIFGEIECWSLESLSQPIKSLQNKKKLKI